MFSYFLKSPFNSPFVKGGGYDMEIEFERAKICNIAVKLTFPLIKQGLG